jgi:outer membrane protein assembly factor BamE (lipoprotein component of BamABCDE complex)
MRNVLVLLVTTIILTSCATSGRINRISVGMNKNQVISTMGNPKSTSATGNVEFLNYKLSETDDDAFYGNYTDYYVKLVNGTVESYGRLGDFNSTKDPTINVNTNSKVESAGEKGKTDKDKMYEELLKLKELYDKGIITKEEYEKEKKEILEKY